MAWIETVQPEEATGKLAELYHKLQAGGKPVGNVVRAYSVKPALMQAAREFSRAACMAQGLSVDVASAPPVGDARQALDTALRYFTAHLIVEMIPVGRFLRYTLPEPLSAS